jgi:hypothetical protein
MDKDSVLEEIFNNDEFGILNVKAKSSAIKNTDERLIASFNEVNEFVEKYNREPQPNLTNISEYQLYTRLKGIRENPEKKEQLKEIDTNNILEFEVKEINSIDDIFNDDTFDLLEDDTDLFEFKHTPKPEKREATDFVARRKPMKEEGFLPYESKFKKINQDLKEGKRKLIDFNENSFEVNNFYYLNGILYYLENINFSKSKESFPSGERIQKNGRTKCVFENRTTSNMWFRSLIRAMYDNGQLVTKNMDEVNETFIENFSEVTAEDEAAGYIYVLSSKSKDERIASMANLYKIGYSTDAVEERIKNAEKEPTYLMAKVKIVTYWKCYNMNPQKLEQLLHNFFGSSCLNIDIYDENKRRHTPREWFVAPLDVIEQAVELIISGEVVDYRYDVEGSVIVLR